MIGYWTDWTSRSSLTTRTATTAAAAAVATTPTSICRHLKHFAMGNHVVVYLHFVKDTHLCQELPQRCRQRKKDGLVARPELAEGQEGTTALNGKQVLVQLSALWAVPVRHDVQEWRYCTVRLLRLLAQVTATAQQLGAGAGVRDRGEGRRQKSANGANQHLLVRVQAFRQAKQCKEHCTSDCRWKRGHTHGANSWKQAD